MPTRSFPLFHLLGPVLGFGGRTLLGTMLAGLLLAPALFAAAPVITSPLTASGTKGVAFSYQITATNNPTSFNSTLGVPSVGVIFATGEIRGTPSSEGTFSTEISATNADGTGSAPLTITIGPPLPTQPVITSLPYALAVLGRPFSYQITATNNPTGFDSGAFGNGLSLDPATGVLSGFPSLGSGWVSSSIRASNAVGMGYGNLLIAFAPETTVLPVVTGPTTATVTVGKSVTLGLSATGDPVLFDATGLPPGLEMAYNSGAINGTTSTPGVYPVTLSALNAAGTGHATLTLTVEPMPAAPVITSRIGVLAGVGVPFSYQITATNNPSSYAWTAGIAGLSLDPSTGVISGTPAAAAGAYVTSIGAANGSGIGYQDLTFTILPASTRKPVITSLPTATAIAGQPFSYQITARYSPISFNAEGYLPGMSVSTGTGIISGTFSDLGPHVLNLGATNAAGTGIATLTLSVVTADSYAGWALAHGLTSPDLANMASELDGDGLVNLLEYALGTDPLQSSTMQTPAVAFDTAANALVLTHRRNKTAAVTWSYQVSTDLVTWTSATPTMSIVNADIDGDSRTELVRALLPLAPGDTRKFLRLAVTAP